MTSNPKPTAPRRSNNPQPTAPRRGNNSQPANKKTSRWKSALFYVCIAGILGLCLVFGLFGCAAYDLPDWNPDQLMGANASKIYDQNDNEVASLHSEENRTQVTLDSVSSNLINAFIATEDTEFYSHHGINFKGIARAIFTNIASGDPTAQGASTITQQLARNTFLTQEKSWKRKLQEVLISFKLESAYSKDEILTFYINKIYFGAGAYGVQAAAQTYFGRNASELDLAESAMIAGLAQSPSAYNPFEHYEKAKKRQRIVLDRMATCKYITQEEADQAFGEELQFNQSHQQGSTAYAYGFFMDAAINEAISLLSEDYENPEQLVYSGGLKIYTGLDPELQSHAQRIFADEDNFPDDSVQSAMTLVDISNGEVKSLMGGRSYTQIRGFNRATSSHRQPGSSLKPISVYSPALESGLMPFTVLDDHKISIDLGDEKWTPKNADGQYRGLISMRTALQFSVNTFAVQLCQKVGVQSGYSMAESCGITLVDKDKALAPMSLGGLTEGTNTMEMAGAYDALGNGGLYSHPHIIRSIVDAGGETVYEYSDKPVAVMAESSAWLMTSMMQTVVQAGTGTQAQIPGIQLAGKTGTTEDMKDAWFCGTTPAYACSVWMGYDSPATMDNTYGGHYPAILCSSMLEKAHELEGGATEFEKPSGIIEVDVCALSGQKPGPKCPVAKEYCVSQFAPKATCDGIHAAADATGVKVCKISGKLANQYCPEVEIWSKTDPNRVIPTETCTIHSAATSGAKDTVKIPVRVVTKDPAYPGQKFLATPEAPRQYTEIIMMTETEKDALKLYPGKSTTNNDSTTNHDTGNIPDGSPATDNGTSGDNGSDSSTNPPAVPPGSSNNNPSGSTTTRDTPAP